VLVGLFIVLIGLAPDDYVSSPPPSRLSSDLNPTLPKPFCAVLLGTYAAHAPKPRRESSLRRLTPVSGQSEEAADWRRRRRRRPLTGGGGGGGGGGGLEGGELT
jgi:hypothetical protein